MDTEPKENQTVLPYTLGGHDDPFFIGDGNPPLNRPSQPNETDYNLSVSDQLRKDAGGCGVPVGAPNEMSAATAVFPRGDCDSNGPATLQTLNAHTHAQSFPTVEEQLKYWTDRDYELIAGRIYRKPWYEREDWEVPGNGGTNDHLFEDDLFEDGDPQEYGDGSPD